MTFEEILTKLEVGMIDFMGEAKDDTFVKVYNYLTGLYKTVKTAPATTEGEKVVPAFVKAWEADTVKAELAAGIMGKFLATLAKYENDPAMMFHLRDQAKAIVGKYLTGEVEWNTFLAEKAENVAPVSQSTRQMMAAEYQAGRLGLAQIYGLVGHTLTVPGEMISADGKNKVPNLPALPGNYGGNGAATGSNAKVYRLNYTVDGTEYGNDAKLAMRAIFTGSDRIGKTTTDLANLLDEKVQNVYGITAPANFVHNGHKVTITRPADK